jgi:hypothetical protein
MAQASDNPAHKQTNKTRNQESSQQRLERASPLHGCALRCEHWLQSRHLQCLKQRANKQKRKKVSLGWLTRPQLHSTGQRPQANTPQKEKQATKQKVQNKQKPLSSLGVSLMATRSLVISPTMLASSGKALLLAKQASSWDTRDEPSMAKPKSKCVRPRFKSFRLFFYGKGRSKQRMGKARNLKN